MRATPKKIKSHLKADMKGYKKEIKYLKNEIKEDEELTKGLKHGKKNESRKGKHPKRRKDKA